MREELETARYELGLEDHDALTRFLTRAQPPAKPGWRVNIVLLALVVLLTAALLTSRALGWPGAEFDSKSAGMGAALPILIVGAMVVYLHRANRRALRDLFASPRNRWMAGPWRARVGPEGLTMVSAYVTQRIGWEIIWEIGEDDHRAYFLLTTSTGHVVPRSAFEYDEDFWRFVELARRLRDAADRAPRATAALPTSEDIQPASDAAGTQG
jgi:YcxB-like protein